MPKIDKVLLEKVTKERDEALENIKGLLLSIQTLTGIALDNAFKEGEED